MTSWMIIGPSVIHVVGWSQLTLPHYFIKSYTLHHMMVRSHTHGVHISIDLVSTWLTDFSCMFVLYDSVFRVNHSQHTR
jgi:hypothetical protein